MLKSFNTLFNVTSQLLEPINTKKQELKDDVKNFLYERIVSIYMRSRQKSWQKFNNLTPEKGTSSLRENLKAIHNDTQNSTKVENKLKKSNILKDPVFGLMQLQVWAQSDDAKVEFSKVFLVSKLQWLLWAFGDDVKKKEGFVTFNFKSPEKRNSFF